MNRALKGEPLRIVERTFSSDPSKMSVGLANINASVPDVEANKDKICRVASIFKEHGVNVAVFPEFSLSGYFWEDERACRKYMDSALIEQHVDWIENSLKPLLDDEFRAIILNNLMSGPNGTYYNSTFPVAKNYDYLAPGNSYQKIFLPGIEKTYTTTGQDDRLVVDTKADNGRFGFTTCYDYLFSDLLREYSMTDQVDGILQVASWRAAATREYPTMNVRTDSYYGDLWNSVMSAASATNQVWTIACNAVGSHGISGVPFWGGSGIWAPSGLKLIQASNYFEELLIVHNLDIKKARADELSDFDYAMDFREIYQPLEGSRGFTRQLQ
ncbi:MAG TPA: carbon-nitrogen hydrolase family protein [Frankiaceae bacterium]|nr:carbon-nitrogen hydrolase family protein [Frankiaceae bacterium]